MQTFLPYDSFRHSASVLDYRRLGKQRVETMQLLSTFLPEVKRQGWLNHPSRLMWKNNLGALAEYGVVICNTWLERNYKDTCKQKILNIISIIENDVITEEILFKSKYEKPFWFGHNDFHSSHRSNLLRKNYDYYKKFGWSEPDNFPYIWPVNNNAT